jgi:hypothetical protein
MTHRTRLAHLAVLLIAVALALNSFGCGSTPIEQAYQVRTVFNEGQRDLIAARPLLDDPTFNALAQAKDAAMPVLDELDRAAIEAQASNIPIARAFQFSTALESARKVIDDWLIRLATAKQTKAKH